MDVPAPLAQKRRRDDDGDGASVSEPVRSEIWKEDGTIVIQARRTQFRVHRSMLSDNSEIIKDMFKLAAPPNESQCVEGCPVVELDDLPEDWYHVLRTLYEWRYLLGTQFLPFPVVAALLRLGKKYGFHALYTAATAVIEKEFPSALSAQLALDALTACNGYHFFEGYSGLNIDLANIINEMGIQKALPMAFYHLARSSVEGLVKGIKRPDGTIANCTPDVLATVLVGREKLLRMQLDVCSWWLLDETIAVLWHCSSLDQCAEAVKFIREELVGSLLRGIFVLQPWDDDWVNFGVRLCDECTLRAQDSFHVGRQDMWDILPLQFGLPSWEVLLAPASHE